MSAIYVLYSSVNSRYLSMDVINAHLTDHLHCFMGISARPTYALLHFLHWSLFFSKSRRDLLKRCPVSVLFLVEFCCFPKRSTSLYSVVSASTVRCCFPWSLSLTSLTFFSSLLAFLISFFLRFSQFQPGTFPVSFQLEGIFQYKFIHVDILYNIWKTMNVTMSKISRVFQVHL